MRLEERKGVMGRVRDQFPIGMRVLAVDDDPVCLKVLETLLRRCQYHVTTTNQAVTALKLLRENRDMFDLVISDVHMPDMDGFKLLEHVGLEMDLPVIMLSVNGETKTVMKGITHGACDYLLKPVRIEELRNIWQHVIRRKFSNREWNNLDVYEECNKPPNADANHVVSQISCGSPDQSGRLSKKRREQHSDEEDEMTNDAQENDDPSAPKKPRVVWSVELHRKFVAAVNQLGIDKAVPKRILELMNVEKLTRENVASHLQKYRLYLKRLSAVASQQASIVAAFGGRDPSFLRVGAFEGLQNYQAFAPSAAILSFNPHGLLNRPNATVFGLQGLAPCKAVQTATSNGTVSHTIGDTNKFQHLSLPENQQGSLTQGLTTSLGQAQLQQKWIHEETNDLSTVFSGSGLVNTISGTLQSITNSPLLPQELLECTQTKVGIQPSVRMPAVNSEHFEGTAGVSSSLLDSHVSQQGAIPLSGISPDGLPIHSSFDSSVTKLETCLSAPQRESDQRRTSAGCMLIHPSNDIMAARDIKSRASSFGNTILLPPDTEQHSKYLNFGDASNFGEKMDEINPDHLIDSKLVWSCLPSSHLPNDNGAHHTTSQRLDSGSFNHNTDTSIIGQANASSTTLAPQMKVDMFVSEDRLKPKDVYDLGISKLQSGPSSSSCNFDGLLNSIIKVEKDDALFSDNDLGCDLYQLGACI